MKSVRTILSILCVLCVRDSGAQDPAASAKLSTSLDALPWMLELDGAGFLVRSNEIKPDGRRYFFAENPQTQVLVSVFLEAARAPVSAGECKGSLKEKEKRNASLSSGPLKRVAYRQTGEMEILDYTLAELDGVPINQKNEFACIPRADAYVDIHISKMLFTEADQPAFDALLQSLRFVPKAVASGADSSVKSVELFEEGSRRMLADQYRDAIEPYRQALELEKKSPKLDKTLWRVLVDNLSMAYGITGDFTNSKATLDYGISKDPGYPLFYYNLACIAAEKADQQEAEKYLKMAIERRGNRIAAERIPDARKDDSFQRLLQKSEFRVFVDSLYEGKE